MSAKYRQRLLQSSGVSNTKFQSQYAKKLMAKMGWKDGNGLGKKQQGTTQCVQIRRRQDGIGLGIKKANETNWKDQWWNDMYNSSIKKMAIIPTKFKKNNKKKDDSSSQQSSDDSSIHSSSSQNSSTVQRPKLIAKNKKIVKKTKKNQ